MGSAASPASAARRKILIRVLAYPYFFELWVRGTPTFLLISRVFVAPRLAHPTHTQPRKSENLKESEKKSNSPRRLRVFLVIIMQFGGGGGEGKIVHKGGGG